MSGDAPWYLEWIKSQKCSIPYCRGRIIEAHHRNQDRFSQRKVSDYESMPLCTTHHRECHQVGYKEFNNTHNYDQHWQVLHWLIKYIEHLRRDDDLPF